MRKFSQRFFGRLSFPFQEQRAKVLGENLVVLKFFQTARTGQRSVCEKVEAKHRSFLHGDLVLSEKRQIEFEAKDTHRKALLDSSKRKAPSAVVLRKTFVSKMHISPFRGAQ